MIFRSLLSFLLVYAAVVLQICFSKWIPQAWGRPQLLLLAMIFLALRDRSGLAVVISAGIGFLADSLEPHGMGRFFLLYSVFGWWLQRLVDTAALRLSRVSLFGIVLLASFLIPMSALIIGFLVQPQQIDFLHVASRILASSLWTSLISLPFLYLYNPQAPRSQRSSAYHRTNHWNMLTNQ